MSKSLDRSIEKSSLKAKKPVENVWDQAIADARQRIADLKYSIRVFEKRRDRGDRWRGEKTA